MWIEMIDGKPYEVSEEELKEVLWLKELEWEDYYKKLPRKDFYAWSQQDELEWKNSKSFRMNGVKEEIKRRNNFANSLQSPILKQLIRVNEDEVCLELVDVDDTRASQLLDCYNERKR